MKRHITELEQRLKDLGFSLKGKTYKGKNSQHTDEYIYGGYIDGAYVKVYLNYRRDTITCFAIENFAPTYLKPSDIELIEKVYNNVRKALFPEIYE